MTAFFAAIDARRLQEQLSWPGLAKAVWEQSSILNARRGDHPIAAQTIRKLGERPQLSCQHALFLLRWLGRPPEAFIAAPSAGTADVPLPIADDGHRLRWSLRKLHGALDAARAARGATWAQAADRLGCTPSQLTGLRTAKFATNMQLAMRITQALRRPAADFVYVAEW
ncbi:MAG: helix-turn-helix transcriptional regulator [Caulobacteraceae bacterium]|nr:helix-turn-helix transcriptional regulator [Caulobacteraceae bacterium]